MSCDFDVAIIGAGLVGLVIAIECSERGLQVVVLERNNTFGTETSSRNSEVTPLNLRIWRLAWFQKFSIPLMWFP